MDPIAVGIEDAAKLVGLSKFTIRAYVRRGWLAATRCGRRIIIPMGELEKLAREGVPKRPERILSARLESRSANEEVTTAKRDGDEEISYSSRQDFAKGEHR